MRRFAIIGSRAPPSSPFNLDDLPGSGRIDVLCRNIGACLLLSHGIRKDVEVVVHLLGGQGKPRRIRFLGSDITGLRADERSIAGKMRKVVVEPLPPVGTWKHISNGLAHSGGDLSTTITEWQRNSVEVCVLDINGDSLGDIHENQGDIGFIVGDDRAIDCVEEHFDVAMLSLGEQWLLGSACISIVHHWLDSQTGKPS
ncbi:MAG: hypothetical protein CMB75_04190 [Euryarchaeota archaeon]|nr:hypothetical protein [Euryarchaeota archaeon]